jgi:hypothetical protein
LDRICPTPPLSKSSRMKNQYQNQTVIDENPTVIFESIARYPEPVAVAVTPSPKAQLNTWSDSDSVTTSIQLRHRLDQFAFRIIKSRHHRDRAIRQAGRVACLKLGRQRIVPIFGKVEPQSDQTRLRQVPGRNGDAEKDTPYSNCFLSLMYTTPLYHGQGKSLLPAIQ